LGFLLLVLGLVLACVAYTALGHPHGRQAGVVGPPASASARGTTAAAEPAVGAHSPVGSHSLAASAAGYGRGAGSGGSATMPVIVLDNTGRPAVARSATELFRQAGWTVTDTGVFDGDILSTAVYYDPATGGAQAAAEALQVRFPMIQRVRPKFDGLPQGPIVVVLTRDYSQGQTTS
jgi:hypothetical protein